MDGIWARSRPHTIAGAATRILSPADNVLHVCGHAAGVRARANLRWASDAWHIIDRHRDLDWQGFLDCAESSGLALPLYVMMRYLAEDLDAPVPSHVVAALAEATGRGGGREREAALLGALTGLTATVLGAVPRGRRLAHAGAPHPVRRPAVAGLHGLELPHPPLVHAAALLCVQALPLRRHPRVRADLPAADGGAELGSRLDQSTI